METVFVIVNPAADSGRAAHAWRRARPLLRRAGMDLKEASTEGAGHATALAFDAGRQGFRTVLFVGGDGTMNEVANGLLDLPAAIRPDLAALPCGTGADLPRGLGLERGAEAALARLQRRRPLAIDVAEASFQGFDHVPARRFFVNIADAGLGGRVVERVNRRSKAVGGFASFLEAILATFWTYEKPELTVHVDGALRHRGPAASVVVANGAYFAGGMRMAPQADFTDGLLDVVVLGDVTRRDLVLNLRRLYRGTHLSHPRVAAFRGRHVSIEGRAPVVMDGEHPGWSPLEVVVRPGALRILV